MLLPILRRYLPFIVICFLLLGGFTVYQICSPPPSVHPGSDIPVDPGVGHYILWTQVDRLYPRGACATVRDFETGLEFKVQRRAGRFHADVQPLTAADTAVMKQIYSDSWTWRRRAVIVILESGEKLAASMNGMPHGAGAIEGNNFNGHFCIHFPDSKTHTSRRIDIAHQMMTWKAAGMIEEKLTAMDSRSLLEVVLTAIDQGDQLITSYIIVGADTAAFLQDMQTIQSLQVSEIKEIDYRSFKVTARAAYKGVSKNRLCTLYVTVGEPDPFYKIPVECFRELVGPAGAGASKNKSVFGIITFDFNPATGHGA